MAKNILIFADGTGQIGGVRPDQRLSNIYKLYRAMRPGPSSPIDPARQVAYYDPGLGSAEPDGQSTHRFQKLQKILDAAVGTGIDDNVIDCYEQIIRTYEPGDRILLFGFSRGAYTVRAVANVMTLCGIPTRMPDGTPLPRHGPRLRKIANDAVMYVYNHGTGQPREQTPYYEQREELGRRFRVKYGGSLPDGAADMPGIVQPTFIGVFDTVGSLNNWLLIWIARVIVVALGALNLAAILMAWPFLVTLAIIAITAVVVWWYGGQVLAQFKFFSPDPDRPLKWENPGDWWQIFRNGHQAVWRNQNYDRWLDPEVSFARHAMAIDEQRTDFARLDWGEAWEPEKTADKKPGWLKQVWFAGCHSDIGGSYPEAESRLSDIALDWMVDELVDCVPEVQVLGDMLWRWPDPLALQHEETYFIPRGLFRRKWRSHPREIAAEAKLHPSVLTRLAAVMVPQSGEVKPYRPVPLKDHPKARAFYEGG